VLLKAKIFLVALVLYGASCSSAFAQASAASGVVRNLTAPPLARTTSTAVLLWDRPAGEETEYSYQIIRDGKLAGETKLLSYTVTNLVADRSYRFTVRSYQPSRKASSESDAVVVETKPAGRIFNVKEFGAKGDGVAKDTAAIQKAIDACTPGGIVLVPPGKYSVDHLE
jgi:exo-poly-alpha-galacturonosidase